VKEEILESEKDYVIDNQGKFEPVVSDARM
jgi:hypothetical protein